ncbi:DUF1501 domain-containing protein, partial [Jatrophihabitans endophyticus]|uniref:DUF1501 domain-containing protein n=1 Tax=Jatrophihabitans endophyticus TaxID=1206085 RepID=UPI0019FAAC05
MTRRRDPQQLCPGRRAALLRLLFGPCGLGLRAFVTGVPMAVLTNPRRALASDDEVSRAAAGAAQFLVVSSSQSGDPLNCNVPGTYGDAAVAHPVAATMAPTTFPLGKGQVTAAKPWASLPASVLARTNFFHHRTDSVGHGDLLKSLRLSGGITRGEILPSLLASQTSTLLGTVQAQPITLGAFDAGEALTYGGRGIPMLRPSALKDVLTMPNGPLKNARKLRDDTLDKLSAWSKKNATAGQATFLDRWANTQADLRRVSDSLLDAVSGIATDDAAGQIAGTVALLQLKASPVLSIHLPFGEDNHGDPGLALEAEQHVTGVAAIGSLMAALDAAGLADRVTFATLNVFGRTLSSRKTDGRDHNENHHVAVLIGKNIRAGVTGGIAPMAGDYGATGINSTDGAATPAGDVAQSDTYAALAKTLGAAVGVAGILLAFKGVVDTVNLFDLIVAT